MHDSGGVIDSFELGKLEQFDLSPETQHMENKW